MGVQAPLERFVGREILECQYTDTLDGQQVSLLRTGEPAVVNLLRRGLRIGFGGLPALPHDTGDLVDQRYSPLLRGERHHAVRRLHGAPVDPSGRPPLGIERPHPRQEYLPASGQQIAYESADLFRHRCTVHFFFFLGVVCAFGAGTTGSGTAPGRVKPRQII